METYYLLAVGLLFLLAIFDLYVGVGNDAVNFLNSAIGSKAASYKTLMFIASIGVFVGASFSTGMMDIARHGIYQPQYFYFNEVMCILLAVMLTDVVLLDMFNSLGLPTSTTVSMVFELLGGTFVLSLIKSANSDLAMSQMINSSKALSVISGIFLSVAIAFVVGSIVQYITRVIFSFNYRKNLKYFIGLYGGIAATAIVYFMLIKGLKNATFMPAEMVLWIKMHTSKTILYLFIGFSILMQILYLFKVKILRFIVLLGTFALAVAFAGNDLVNFIGVPLAGFSSYTDFMANGNGQFDSFLMTSLQKSASTEWYFLFIAGAIMIFSLVTSKKAKEVVKTSVDLSRQEEGEESFGSIPIARSIVRSTSNFAMHVVNVIPLPARKWIDSRFKKDELILNDNAAFDMVRASVNLVLAAILISFGTSLKLPLSTTYVTFMVAMGTSLADRAWNRESAVFRITGVLSVIGGWFLTAAVAFVLTGIFVLILYFGGWVGTILLVLLDLGLIIKSQFSYNSKKAKKVKDPIVTALLSSKDEKKANVLFNKYSINHFMKFMDFTYKVYPEIINGFIDSKLKVLRNSSNAIEDEFDEYNKAKRLATLGVRHLSIIDSVERGGFFYQNMEFEKSVLFGMQNISDACLEHIDNNFNPIDGETKKELQSINLNIDSFLKEAVAVLENQDFDNVSKTIKEGDAIVNHLAIVRRKHMNRLRTKTCSVKLGMVYLTILQETQSIISYSMNILRLNKRFLKE